MKSHKKIWGIVLIVYPIIGLPIVLTIYAIMSFVSSNLTDPQSTTIVVFRILKVLLGLLGVLCVLGVFIAIPIGIILLASSAKKTEK